VRQSASMPRSVPPPSRQLPVGRRALFSMVCLALVGTAAYSLGVVWRVTLLYRGVKSVDRGLRGKIYHSDPELGYAPIPGSRGSAFISGGLEVAIRFDERGFRVPSHAPAASRDQRPRILALGCSWTYGAACQAEEAYPYLVAEALGGEALNAGVGGYGLAQMLVLARRLIPRYEPDYVTVQYADWLVTRAQTTIAPTLLGTVPTPYFYASDDGIRLHPPSFSTALFDLPVWEYASDRDGAMESLSFLVRVGVPLFVHDDVTRSAMELRRLFRTVPPPAAAADEVVRSVYGEIASLARAHGSRLIVVVFGDTHPAGRQAQLGGSPDTLVAEAQSSLWRELGLDDSGSGAGATEAYQKAYAHWRGAPPVAVDWHPNQRAHAVTAREIVKVIEEGAAGVRSDAS